MHLRPITPADVPRCGTIVDTAFEHNELYNFIAPDRAKYPLSWRQLVLKVQYGRNWQPNAWGVVCVADADDDFAPAGEILGCARWMRRTSSEDAAIAVDVNPWTRDMSLMDHVESWLRWAELKWEMTLRINPAKVWTNEDAFMRVVVQSTGFAPLRGKTHWWLDSLAVAPEYQRRGVARRLVDEGLRRAGKETEERIAEGKAPVPVALIATVDGLQLYRNVGFKVVGWEDDSFMDFAAAGGSALVWDPTGYWIRDVEYEHPVRRGVVEAVYTTGDTKDVSKAGP
jgi:ribosomal protein S18 acetylase RimI-like enzyme